MLGVWQHACRMKVALPHPSELICFNVEPDREGAASDDNDSSVRIRAPEGDVPDVAGGASSPSKFVAALRQALRRPGRLNTSLQVVPAVEVCHEILRHGGALSGACGSIGKFHHNSAAVTASIMQAQSYSLHPVAIPNRPCCSPQARGWRCKLSAAPHWTPWRAWSRSTWTPSTLRLPPTMRAAAGQLDPQMSRRRCSLHRAGKHCLAPGPGLCSAPAARRAWMPNPACSSRTSRPTGMKVGNLPQCVWWVHSLAWPN